MRTPEDEAQFVPDPGMAWAEAGRQLAWCSEQRHYIQQGRRATERKKSEKGDTSAVLNRSSVRGVTLVRGGMTGIRGPYAHGRGNERDGGGVAEQLVQRWHRRGDMRQMSVCSVDTWRLQGGYVTATWRLFGGRSAELTWRLYGRVVGGEGDGTTRIERACAARGAPARACAHVIGSFRVSPCRRQSVPRDFS